MRAKNIGFTTKRITENDIRGLISVGCDLVIVAAYPYKIPIVKGMPRMVNIHPTLIPYGRGPWPLPWIILKGLKKSGVTIHKIARDFDVGDILIQDGFTVANDDNLETVSVKSQMLAEALLGELLKRFDHYWNEAKKQSVGSYWKMPEPKDRTIDWNSSVADIDRVVRAFGKFESYARFSGKDWLVRDVVVWKERHFFELGTVVNKVNKMAVVAAKDGFVCVRDCAVDKS